MFHPACQDAGPIAAYRSGRKETWGKPGQNGCGLPSQFSKHPVVAIDSAAKYRAKALAEAFRVLRPGGALINGDRYAIDDRNAHLADTQNIVRGWFKLFRQIDRLDLLEDWIVHLISDESPKIIMYYTPSLEQLRQIGFSDVSVDFRDGVDTLIRATKPL